MYLDPNVPPHTPVESRDGPRMGSTSSGSLSGYCRLVYGGVVEDVGGVGTGTVSVSRVILQRFETRVGG